MSIRIPLSRAPVTDLDSRLQHAYRRDDGRLVRRITVVIDLLVPHVPVDVLHERWGLSLSCLDQWRQDCLRRGLDRVVSHQSGGRRPQWPPKQQKRWVELREAGPLVVGGETAWWTAGLLRGLIWRAFGVLANGPYVWTLLHHWGCSFPKARWVSDHRETAKRLAWLAPQWPTM